jgi:hypothetical protein
MPFLAQYIFTVGDTKTWELVDASIDGTPIESYSGYTIEFYISQPNGTVLSFTGSYTDNIAYYTDTQSSLTVPGNYECWFKLTNGAFVGSTTPVTFVVQSAP